MSLQGVKDGVTARLLLAGWTRQGYDQRGTDREYAKIVREGVGQLGLQPGSADDVAVRRFFREARDLAAVVGKTMSGH